MTQTACAAPDLYGYDAQTNFLTPKKLPLPPLQFILQLRSEWKVRVRLDLKDEQIFIYGPGHEYWDTACWHSPTQCWRGGYTHYYFDFREAIQLHTAHAQSLLLLIRAFQQYPFIENSDNMEPGLITLIHQFLKPPESTIKSRSLLEAQQETLKYSQTTLPITS